MHLIKSIQKEKDPFYPTELNIKMWFRIINKLIFDNALTPFGNIVIKDMGDWWACVVHEDPLDLHINTEFSSKIHFVNILAHEMVHKWQLDINHDSGWHNKHFYSWRQKFKENALNLTRKV